MKKLTLRSTEPAPAPDVTAHNSAVAKVHAEAAAAAVATSEKPSAAPLPAPARRPAAPLVAAVAAAAVIIALAVGLGVGLARGTAPSAAAAAAAPRPAAVHAAATLRGLTPAAFAAPAVTSAFVAGVASAAGVPAASVSVDSVLSARRRRARLLKGAGTGAGAATGGVRVAFSVATDASGAAAAAVSAGLASLTASALSAAPLLTQLAAAAGTSASALSAEPVVIVSIDTGGASATPTPSTSSAPSAAVSAAASATPSPSFGASASPTPMTVSPTASTSPAAGASTSATVSTSPAASSSPAAAAAPGVVVMPRPKRGFVGSGCSGAGCADAGSLLVNSSWFYSYDYVTKFEGATTSPGNFVPMSWCTSSINATIPAGTNTTFAISINEPNLASQCNKDPAVIAASFAWTFAKFPATTKFVGPALAGNGTVWFDQFLGNCTLMYGASGCRLSFMAAHIYSCTTSSMMNWISWWYGRYNLPIWISEFSCNDGATNRSVADNLKYMTDVLPLLDAHPAVYRYAWMTARDTRGSRSLVQDGPGGMSLTVLGQAYNAL